MNFISQMINLRDRTAKIAPNFGVPNIRSLIIRTRVADTIQYIEITPTPVITEISNTDTRIASMGGISGTSQAFVAKGVSRRYTLQQLEYEAVDYIVDAKFENSQLITGGIVCQLVSITENSITWDLSLVQKLGEQSLYLEN